MTRRLKRAELDELRRLPLTYAEVGRTRASMPDGYHLLQRERVLQTRDLERAADDLMTWQVQSRAGLRVEVSSDRVEVDAIVATRLGFGPFGVTAPCRIVYVVDEPDRRGFAYGTLAGHPESGEEAFVIDRDPDGRLTFAITAFSRTATTLARAAGPVGRLVQRAVTSRYLRALDR